MISEIIAYVKHPVLITERERFTPNHLRKLITISIILAMSIGIAVGVFLSILGLESPAYTGDVDSGGLTTRQLVTIIVIAPVIEEIVFRSWLGRKSTVIYFFPAFLLLVGLIVLFFVGANTAPILFWISILALGVYTFLIKSNGPRNIHLRLTNRYFPYVFWTSSILFGLVHIGNFSTSFAMPVLVLMVLPQTIAGFILGYTRMRFGLLACILLHGFYNGTITLIGNLVS